MLTFKSSDIKTFTWGITILTYTFLLVFTARFPAYTPFITKGLTPLLLIITLLFFKNPLSKFPKEYFVYIALFVWAALSVIKVDIYSFYFRYLQLFLGVTMLLTITMILLPRYKIFNYFHLGFILSAILLLYHNYINFDLTQVVTNEITGTRVEGITGDANTTGGIFLLGSLSVLFALDSTRNLMIKICLLVVLVAFMIGIVATASRSSTLSVVTVGTLYVIGKLYLNKRYFILIASSVLLFITISAGYNFIMENTFMGQRIARLQKGKDGSGNVRRDLIFQGFDMVRENPFFGVGLGNFTNNTKSHHFAHNDLVEITATIGIIGLCVYLLLYILFEIKIINLQKKQLSKEHRGRLMIIQICLFTYFLSGLFRPIFIDLFFMFYLGVLIAEVQRLKIQYAHLPVN